jgi:flagellar hook-length control protein FliK
LAQGISALLPGAIASGLPANPAALPANSGANVDFASILSETAQAQSANIPSQLPETSDVTLTPSARARFNISTPGAFHPRTAFQKILTEAEPQTPPLSLPLQELPPGIETKPTSTSLLSLLGVITSADTEPAEEEIVSFPTENSVIGSGAPLLSPAPDQTDPQLASKADFSTKTAIAAVSAANIPVARSESSPESSFNTTENAEFQTKSESAAVSRASASGFEQDLAPTQAELSASGKSAAPTIPLPQPHHPATSTVTQTTTLAASDAPRLPAASIAQVPHLISVEAVKLDLGGTREFTIRLDPAELGRIDVKLEVKADGYVTAIVQADQASTYDLLRQDARQFEQSLWDSGLKTTSDSLNFSLRRDEQSGFAQLMSSDGQSNGGGNNQKLLSDTDSDDKNRRQPANHRLSLSYIDVMA